MKSDLQRIPVAVELFAQWRTARGNRNEDAKLPFSRSWATLLADAGITSALEEREAEHDARVLATEGLISLRTVRYKPHLIERVSIPLAAEPRWREAFGFVPPSDEERRRIRAHPWHPRLAFASDANLFLSFEELERIHQFLSKNGAGEIPIKERSLQIFGDEKRLDMLYGSSALFGPGRLTLADLRCFVVPEPLSWKRGSHPDGPVIVLENLATWHSYARWDALHRQFSALIYGGGKRFIDAVLSLPDLFAELGGSKTIFYFGDLDAAGLRIPRLASARSVAGGLLAIQPHLWSYQLLLSLATGRENVAPSEPVTIDPADLAWLGELGPAAEAILRSGVRIPQEVVGWEILQKSPSIS